jgi:hypothetical protein
MTEHRFNPDEEASKGLSGLGFALAVGGAALAYWWMNREVEEDGVSEQVEEEAEPSTSEQASAPPRVSPRFQPVLPHAHLTREREHEGAVRPGPLDTNLPGRRL